jgi:hypothetical protein
MDAASVFDDALAHGVVRRSSAGLLAIVNEAIKRQRHFYHRDVDAMAALLIEALPYADDEALPYEAMECGPRTIEAICRRQQNGHLLRGKKCINGVLYY